MHAVAGIQRRLALSGISAAILVALVMTMAPASVHAGRGITIQAWMGSSCLFGRTTNKATVAVSWRDDDGHLKQKGSTRANGKGFWEFCGDGNEMIAKGDTIVAKVGSKSRTLVIPRLKLAIDRVTNVVNGKGPVSTSVTLEACRHTSFDNVVCSEKTLVTQPDGTFTHDFSPQANLKGRDWVSLILPVGRHAVIRNQEVPFIAVARGKPRFWGYFKPFKMVTIELRNGGGSLRDEWQGRADDWDWGFFRGRFADAEGDTIRVKAGNQVIVPKFGSDADWFVPDVRSSAARKSDVVKGNCDLPSAPYRITAWSPGGGKVGRKVGRTSPSGSFSHDMTRKIDLKRGYIVWVTCSLPTGDLVERRLVVS